MLQLICLDLAFIQVGEEEVRIGTYYKVSQAPDSISRLNCLTKAIFSIYREYILLKVLREGI